MGANEIKGAEKSVSPPRWAEALLRAYLAPDGESESGDLLEIYRDSAYPARGGWRADVWFVSQVLGCILRSKGANVRGGILAGLALCVLTIAVTVLRYPGALSTAEAAIVAAGLLCYGYAGVWQTRPVTSEDATDLQLGGRYGIAIGVLWSFALIGANFQIWTVVPWPVLVISAFLLPLIVGAHAATRLWRVRAGMRVGFWSGLISGLMSFFVLMAIGYLCAFIPGIPGAEIPDNIPYTSAEFEQLNVLDAFGGGLYFFFLIGGVYGVIAGAGGGLLGILLARTGRGPEESRRVLWSLLTVCILGSTIGSI
jgi:hypothetical protein